MLGHAHGEDAVVCGGPEKLVRGYSGPQVIKSHIFHKRLADRADLILTSWRPFYDAVESWRRFRKARDGRDHSLESAVRAMSVGLDHFQHWQLRSDYCMQWGDATTKKGRRRIISDLRGVLGVETSTQHVLKKMEETVPPESGQDPTTLLFAEHITNPQS